MKTEKKQTMFKDIEHNLKCAEPAFRKFIYNIDPLLSKWIQYTGTQIEGSQLYFTFKSSQNSLSFKVYAGVNIGNTEFLINAQSNEIYEYFKSLKYSIIENKN